MSWVSIRLCDFGDCQINAKKGRSVLFLTDLVIDSVNLIKHFLA